jgi:hypothetical protein
MTRGTICDDGGLQQAKTQIGIARMAAEPLHPVAAE